MDIATHVTNLGRLTGAPDHDTFDHGALGSYGESLALRHLESDDGYEIVARNWQVASEGLRGELDLIAFDHTAGCLVVCEVKTRRNAQRFGGAINALSVHQQRRIRALARLFLRDGAPRNCRVRFDFVAVDMGRRASLTHVVDAW